MNELIKFAIEEWPLIASALVLVAMAVAFVCLPLVALLWMSNLMNRHRYVFTNSEKQLYRLDTMTGSIHVARGIISFDEVAIINKKNKTNKNPT